MGFHIPFLIRIMVLPFFFLLIDPSGLSSSAVFSLVQLLSALIAIVLLFPLSLADVVCMSSSLRQSIRRFFSVIVRELRELNGVSVKS